MGLNDKNLIVSRLYGSEVRKLSRMSLDGVLHFEYIESAPGSRAPAISSDLSLIIPVQDAPIRIISDQNGRTERFTLHHGDIALAHSGGLISWQWLDPAKVIIIHINPTSMRRFVQAELKVLVKGCRLEQEVLIHDTKLRSMAEKMQQTLHSAELGFDVVFDALARLFLVFLVRGYGDPQEVNVAFSHGFGMQHYAQVVDYIEHHLGDKITPAKLAGEVGMSEAAFARKFKQKVGQTPMRFVAQVRLEAASRMLGEGSASLSQIAVRCGFADHAHLSRSFKKHLGVSPSQFRADHRVT